MKISCLLGQHWPIAAFSPWQDGHQTSQCVDCGTAMEKQMGSTWRRASRPSRLPATLVAAGRGSRSA